MIGCLCRRSSSRARGLAPRNPLSSESVSAASPLDGGRSGDRTTPRRRRHRLRHRARIRGQRAAAREALRGDGAADRDEGRYVTPRRRWIADGRAKAIRADCEASLAALDGLPIDLYLIHAPDPRTPWRTSVRALARLVDEGSFRASASRTSTCRSSTKRSSTRRSRRCRSRSARSTRRASRRRRRALRGARAHADRALAARRAAARRDEPRRRRRTHCGRSRSRGCCGSRRRSSRSRARDVRRPRVRPRARLARAGRRA